MRNRLAKIASLVCLWTLLLSGCTVPTTIPPTVAPRPDGTVDVVTATFKVFPQGIASGTATCPQGEALISGGYSTSDALPSGTLGVVESYPSDAAGAPPSSQGQAESSWTVRAHNGASAIVTYTVSANCLTGLGYPVATGVWSAPILPKDDYYVVADVFCPVVPNGILTGGGYQFTPAKSIYSRLQPVMWSVPVEYFAGRRWQVAAYNGSGTAYAVCAQSGIGLTQDPEVIVNIYSGTLLGPNHVQGVVPIACPPGELTVSGGFWDGDSSGMEWPQSVDALTLGSPPQWTVAFNLTNVDPEWYNLEEQPHIIVFGGTAACVSSQSPLHRPMILTFSNYHHLLRIPSDGVVVATDGSGQVKANAVTVRVTQVASGPIAATKVVNPFTGGVSYVVPANCGAPTPAIEAATTALRKAAPDKIPADQVAFGDGSVSIDRGSLTCSPAAGTQRSAPFTYTQAIDGIDVQAAYNPNDVRLYQYRLLAKAAQGLGSQYALRDTLLCPGTLALHTSSATHATVDCAAYGVADWQWSADALQSLARSLAGKSKSAAVQLLDATPGIEAGSSTFQQLSGSTLPTDANAIAIVVVRTQDTAPVFRAP